jgi:hypothetical protein
MQKVFRKFQNRKLSKGQSVVQGVLKAVRMTSNSGMWPRFSFTNKSGNRILVADPETGINFDELYRPVLVVHQNGDHTINVDDYVYVNDRNNKKNAFQATVIDILNDAVVVKNTETSETTEQNIDDLEKVVVPYHMLSSNFLMAMCGRTPSIRMMFASVAVIVDTDTQELIVKEETTNSGEKIQCAITSPFRDFVAGIKTGDVNFIGNDAERQFIVETFKERTEFSNKPANVSTLILPPTSSKLSIADLKEVQSIISNRDLDQNPLSEEEQILLKEAGIEVE